MTPTRAAGPSEATGRARRPAGLRPAQVAWLAGAVFSVSAGYGALLPVLPSWLATLMPGVDVVDVGRHVGFLSGVYAAGVLFGAPLWGAVSDRLGRRRVLIAGLVGYVTSLLLLLVPAATGLWGLYALRGATGFFVAAVIPVVAALVAEHTPMRLRARRFAWLGAMSLVGFLFGPALSAVGVWLGPWVAGAPLSPTLSAKVVLLLSASLGAVMMLVLARTLPTLRGDAVDAKEDLATSTGVGTDQASALPLYWLSGVVMFVLAGFELGIVLQEQHSSEVTSSQSAIMLAECSLVMLGVNALLFITSLLEKMPARTLIGTGLLLATAGLIVLATDPTDAWMYFGVSLTSAGTGLVLPVIAYLAAATSPPRLGAVMGGLAAASGLGQTLGSAAGGELFGAVQHLTFAWLAAPLIAMTGLMLTRHQLWSGTASTVIHPR